MADSESPTAAFRCRTVPADEPPCASAPRAARASVQPAALLLPPGCEIEEFRIEAPLGVGGFGITYLAYDSRLERRVALKEYMPESLVVGRDPLTRHPIFRGPGASADFRAFLDRFRDEALQLARFNHKNIVPIHRVLTHNGTAYIVMEYLGEISLGRLVAAGERLAEPELAHLIGGVLDGLAAMHAAKLLHRDIKPSNIMLRGDGTPVLIDFGSVRRAHYEGEPASVRVVSEGFSPPEQYDDDGEIGPWSDIFALAATCYFAMRGEPPAPVVDRVLALMRRKPDPIVPLTPETTGGLYAAPFLAAVSAGLALRERERPQSVPDWAALFPPPVCHRRFAEPAAYEFSTPADPFPAPADLRDESPATLVAAEITGSALPLVRAQHRGRRVARIAPAHPRETRMRLLGQLTALALVIVGAAIAVGVATDDIGPLDAAKMAETSPASGDGRVETMAAPLAVRAAAPSADAARCDELAAHPDDPGKPASVAGVQFDSITENGARQAAEACAAALRQDGANLRAQFNLGRAYQRIARLKPQESAEAWRRAGEAYAAAAKGGYAAAQGNYGQMLYGGLGGVAPDLREAVDWLKKAAAGNFPDAYLTLAFAYTTGRGVEQADQRKTFCFLTLLERTTSIPAYRALAQQQRAAMAIGAAEKKRIEESAARGRDCL
jgi:serine/threonine protein kinase